MAHGCDKDQVAMRGSFLLRLKRALVVALWLVASGVCHGQGVPRVYGEKFQIAQKEGSEARLREVLSALPNLSDTVYAVLFTPQMCPRCEVDVNFLYDAIKEREPNASVVLWMVYLDAQGARRYAKSKNFRYTHLLADTMEWYKDIFSLSFARLHITYTVKIDQRGGRLIVGGEMEELSPATFDSLVAARMPMPFHDYGTTVRASQNDSRAPAVKPLRYREVLIEEGVDGKMPVSRMSAFPALRNDLLCFRDEIANAFYLFKVEGKRAVPMKKFVTRPEEEIAFVDTALLSPQDFRKGIEDNMFFVMPNMGRIDDDEEVYLSYSLPELIRSPYDSTRLGYFNAPAFFRWDPRNDARSMVRLKLLESFDATKQVFVMDHQVFYLYKDEFLIRTIKGYPIFGSIEEWKGRPADYDVTLPEFYDEAPVFARYSMKTGLLLGFLGQLDTVYRHYQAGYASTLSRFASHGERIAYSCGSSGLVHISSATNRDSIVCTIKVFDAPAKEPEQKSGTMERYVEMRQDVFSDFIWDIKLQADRITVLSREGGVVWLRSYSLSGKLLKEGTLSVGDYKICLDADDSEAPYALYQNGNEVGAFTMFAKNGKKYLAMFKL